MSLAQRNLTRAARFPETVQRENGARARSKLQMLGATHRKVKGWVILDRDCFPKLTSCELAKSQEAACVVQKCWQSCYWSQRLRRFLRQPKSLSSANWLTGQDGSSPTPS